MYNKVILIGRIATDVELVHTPNNKVVTRTSIAVNRRYYDVDFINLIFWGKLAELFVEHTRKGVLVQVEGELRTSSYEKEGQRIYRTDVVVSSFSRLEKLKNSNADDSVFGRTEQLDIDEDDLPF